MFLKLSFADNYSLQWSGMGGRWPLKDVPQRAFALETFPHSWALRLLDWTAVRGTCATVPGMWEEVSYSCWGLLSCSSTDGITASPNNYCPPLPADVDCCCQVPLQYFTMIHSFLYMAGLSVCENEGFLYIKLSYSNSRTSCSVFLAIVYKCNAKTSHFTQLFNLFVVHLNAKHTSKIK